MFPLEWKFWFYIIKHFEKNWNSQLEYIVLSLFNISYNITLLKKELKILFSIHIYILIQILLSIMEFCLVHSP
jgi:hypothetical protein